MQGTAPDGPILVTGAAGFVGGYVLKELVRAGIPESSIHAVSRDEETRIPGAGHVAQADISMRESVDAIVRKTRPAAIIHLAAIAEPAAARKNRDAAWKINFDAVRYIADALLESAPESRLVFAGSAEAYGTTFNDYDGPVPEAALLQPANTYGATKAAADVLLGQMARDGLDAVRCRAFNQSGAGQAPAYVVSAFATQIARIEAGLQDPVIRVGNLDAKRDFLHVRDVARAYCGLVMAPSFEDAAPVFNVSSGQAQPVWSILDLLLKHANRDISVETDTALLRPSEVPSASGDNARITAAIGWQPETTFEDMVLDTLDGARRAVRG